MLKKINEFRRILTTILTKNIGNSYKNPAVDLSEKVTIKRVLICRPNHRLGNLLLITPFLQEISSTFPKCKIDLFVKGGLGPIIFKNYETTIKAQIKNTSDTAEQENLLASFTNAKKIETELSKLLGTVVLK